MNDSRFRKNAQLGLTGTELYFVSYSCSNTNRWVREMWCTGSEVVSLIQHAIATNCSDICVDSESALDEIVDYDIEENYRPITMREYQYGTRYQEMHEFFSDTFKREFLEQRGVRI